MRRAWWGLGIFLAGLFAGWNLAALAHKADLETAVRAIKETTAEHQACVAANRALSTTIDRALLVMGGWDPALVVMRANARPKPPMEVK